MLWGISVCVLLSGASALKTQHEFLQVLPSSKSTKVDEAHSEEVFSFRQASRQFPSLLASMSKMKLQIHANHANQPLRTINNSSSKEAVNSAIEVNSQPLSISFHIQGRLAGVEFVFQIVGIVIVVFLLACTITWIIQYCDSEAQAPENDNSVGRVDKLVQSSTESYLQSIASGHPASPPTKTREMLAESIDGGNTGTWACTYRRADDRQKDALELLFRCGIIPRHEFASSRVSQEHIDECMWISMHMLRQRPLEEWIALWPEAQQTFEESVTACFAARTNLLDTLRTDSPRLDGPVERPEPTDAYGRRRAMMQGGPQPLPAQMAEDAVLRSKDSTGQNLLIIRCREIMAATRPEGPVEEDAIAAQTLPPVVQEGPEATPLQSQVLDATMPSSAKRVKLRVFEEVVPGSSSMPREDMYGMEDATYEEAYSMAMQASAEGEWMQYQDGSSAACSTSTFRTRDPEPSEKYG